ncbi:nucleoside diphosphate kinase [Rhizoctonia solani AG-1 IA]|uniref:Nucleoside diphosphate kinase n=1 Tax=Thanatephorus cucumeris (strain AG1-IA) TaxID=983506 RepID=L8XA88_THACA|nr:nucleoside diphosphate kinase [Rhizoctonia solani AG-1 IA]
MVGARYLIVGANRGIGLEFVKQLVSRRYIRARSKVIGTYRNAQTIDELKKLSEDAANEVRANLGEIDILVVNAGANGGKPLLTEDIANISRLFDNNVLGPIRVCQAFVPLLQNRSTANGVLPKIALISSESGSITVSKHGRGPAYAISKAGLNMMGRKLAHELEFSNVAVGLLHPGWVQTDMGGSGAIVTPEDSVRGMLQVIDKLDIGNSGGFWDYEGKERMHFLRSGPDRDSPLNVFFTDCTRGVCKAPPIFTCFRPSLTLRRESCALSSPHLDLSARRFLVPPSNSRLSMETTLNRLPHITRRDFLVSLLTALVLALFLTTTRQTQPAPTVAVTRPLESLRHPPPLLKYVDASMPNNQERSYIMIKPDGVQRALVGEILSRFEKRGFKIVALKLVHATKEHLEEHYGDLKDKPFFPGLIKYMASGPVVAIVIEGLDAVKTGRAMLGATNPLASGPGTIRGDYALAVGRNICHGSDSIESAEKEIKHTLMTRLPGSSIAKYQTIMRAEWRATQSYSYLVIISSRLYSPTPPCAAWPFIVGGRRLIINKVRPMRCADLTGGVRRPHHVKQVENLLPMCLSSPLGAEGRYGTRLCHDGIFRQSARRLIETCPFNPLIIQTFSISVTIVSTDLTDRPAAGFQVRSLEGLINPTNVSGIKMRLPSIWPRVGLFAIATARYAAAATGGSYCGTIPSTQRPLSQTLAGWQCALMCSTREVTSLIQVNCSGFGESMVGSPMVIMWANEDGTLVLSQREATVAHAQPQVVSTPPRVAAIRSDLSTLTGSAVSFSFSVPSSGQSSERMIYAFGRTKPNSNSVSATLAQHSVTGSFTLNLAGTVPDSPLISASPGGTGSVTTTTLAVPTQSGGSGSDTLTIPYSAAERKLLAHGILSALGFCFFLPIGVLQARFLRIWWPTWFKTHWIVQAGLAGPFIVAGFALAVNVVQEAGMRHFNDKHTIIGLVLFLLYVCQALYGLIIHIVKDPYRRRRPAQNYGHAILGLAIIALSLYQVWLGFNHEWPSTTGRDRPAQGLRTFWIIWVVVLGAAYIIGLALLPKQYKAERYAVQDGGKNVGYSASDVNVHPMSTPIMACFHNIFDQARDYRYQPHVHEVTRGLASTNGLRCRNTDTELRESDSPSLIVRRHSRGTEYSYNDPGTPFRASFAKESGISFDNSPTESPKLYRTCHHTRDRLLSELLAMAIGKLVKLVTPIVPTKPLGVMSEYLSINSDA